MLHQEKDCIKEWLKHSDNLRRVRVKEPLNQQSQSNNLLSVLQELCTVSGMALSSQ